MLPPQTPHSDGRRPRCPPLRWAGLLAPLLGLALAVAPAAAQPGDAGPAAATELNRFRAAAGLDPVTPDPTSAAPLHAHYLALNTGTPAASGLRVHTEDPGQPGFSPQGAAVAARSDIDQGAPSVELAVDHLVDAPLHRHGLLTPSLSTLGVGGEAGWWVLDLSSALAPPVGGPRVVAYPAPGQAGVPLAFPGDETPNPLTAIPGVAPDAAVGYPISLHFFGCLPEDVQASLTNGAAPVPTYLVPPGTVLQADGGQRTVPFALLFPQQPLSPSTTYAAHVSARCGALGQRSFDWPFTTRAALDPAATQLAVGPRGADPSQPVTLRLLDADQLPAAGTRLTAARWSFPSGGGRPPALRADQAEAGRDGTLRVAFDLGDAPSADLQLDLLHDGQPATIPVRVTPAGGGQLGPDPTIGDIPVDPAASAAWAQAQGVDVAGARSAPADPGCPPGFAPGLAELKELLGPAMGEPLACQHLDAQSGDTLQPTTTGLAAFRATTATPTFTNGWEHWALTPAGLLSSTGDADAPGPSAGATGP